MSEEEEAALIALDACANCDYPQCSECSFSSRQNTEVDRTWVQVQR